ncbi:hypothetical protein BpHYR1_031227 [Brachionus plicatilis]|uniref:Saposin B-type domain-containing protein n=1 Tax=Brachionus plicatilis TaxID=10195 RepID=A0A3M7PW98_BRAPC|nr:hypothetical protein BpHYR1_031227 [Brachionus plicatilis]
MAKGLKFGLIINLNGDQSILKFRIKKIRSKSSEKLCNFAGKCMSLKNHELANNKTEEAVVNALEKACKIAPASLRDQCDALINSYGN